MTIVDITRHLNLDYLKSSNVSEYRTKFYNNHPFPHIILDNLFSKELLDSMNKEFEEIRNYDWHHVDDVRQFRRESRTNQKLKPAAQTYFNLIYSGLFVEFIEKITSIKGLICDPMLLNGGLHELPPGGKVDLHLDVNQHLVSKLNSKLTLITYLSRNWDPSYGGLLQLWDSNCGLNVEIVPYFGRTVAFLQTAHSIHGVTPVGQNKKRRSAIAYYYGTDEESVDSYHGTVFISKISKRSKLVNLIKYIMPPFVSHFYRTVKGKLGPR